mgnify:CR=1 FL=1
MNNVLEYKGYYTVIKIDFENHQLYGKIEDISDLVNFMSDSIEGIVREFHSAVDDYLKFCSEIGKSPAKPEEKLELVRA